MIRAFHAAGVEAPWYRVVDGREQLDENGLTFPCIVKPTDNAGSRGVVLVNNRAYFMEAYEYSVKESKSGRVIVEEYLEGPEVSVEVMVVGGKIHILAVTDKLTTGAPHFVEMGHTIPSAMSSEKLERIKDLAARAVKAVGIENGPAHVEMIYTAAGPRMVELGARMGGDCITTHLVPLATGIDMVKASIDTALGREPDLSPKFARGSAIRYFDVPDGKFVSISGVKEASAITGVDKIRINRQTGETIGAVKNSIDRFGYVIASGEDANHAIQICRQAMDIIKIKTE